MIFLVIIVVCPKECFTLLLQIYWKVLEYAQNSCDLIELLHCSFQFLTAKITELFYTMEVTKLEFVFDRVENIK